MKQTTVEVYSETPNLAVVRMPEKEFPGLLIPGESLHVFWGSAESIINMARHGDTNAVLGEAGRLAETLNALLHCYADALTNHQMKLPFLPLYD